MVTAEKRDARSLSSEVQYELRLRGVSLIEKGYPKTEVAEILDVSLSCVKKWWKMYQQDGLEGLKLGQRGRQIGAHRILTPNQEIAIQETIQSSTPDHHNLPYSYWNNKSIRHFIELEYGCQIPERTLYDYLKRWNAPHRAK